MRYRLFALTSVLGALLAAAALRGHTPINSRFTYNDDVYPIFLARCGACHAPNGVAPMSLLTYEDAYPWAQAIKEEVVALTMPPWQPEAGLREVRQGQTLTARELDLLVEWANGGTPQGDLDGRPEPVDPVRRDWVLGPPSLELAPAEPVVLGEDASRADRYFVLTPGPDVDRWVRAIDFLPGRPEVVRSATLYLDSAGIARARAAAGSSTGFDAAELPVALDEVLMAWVPGQGVTELGDDAGYHLPAGADLVLRIRYRKTWIYEGMEITDASRLGLYLTEGAPTRTVERVLVSPPPSADQTGIVEFSRRVDRDTRLVALMPDLATDAAFVHVEAVHADGTRVPLLWIDQLSPEWRTRYAFEEPVVIPQGGRLSVMALPAVDSASEREDSASSTAPWMSVVLEVIASDPATAAHQ